MSVMAAARSFDVKPLYDLIDRHGGQCSFNDALQLLIAQGLTSSDALDGIWRLLSQGSLEFTSERNLRIPDSPALAKVAG